MRVSPRRWLNLQEYQSKKLMQDSGVTVQRFFVADTASEALEAAKRLSKCPSHSEQLAIKCLNVVVPLIDFSVNIVIA